MIRPSQEKRIFDTKDGPFETALFDILWVDYSDRAEAHFTRLHLSDRVVVCTKPFESLRPVLGDAFLPCLASGAVNQLRVRSFEADRILLDNDETLTVPMFFAQKFRDKYCRYLASLVWED